MLEKCSTGSCIIVGMVKCLLVSGKSLSIGLGIKLDLIRSCQCSCWYWHKSSCIVFQKLAKRKVEALPALSITILKNKWELFSLCVVCSGYKSFRAADVMQCKKSEELNCAVPSSTRIEVWLLQHTMEHGYLPFHLEKIL